MQVPHLTDTAQLKWLCKKPFSYGLTSFFLRKTGFFEINRVLPKMQKSSRSLVFSGGTTAYT
jgi:hypothetical protein